jgi:hypothetical protein
MEALATNYFAAWNEHDVAGIEAMLAPEATLRDWDIEKSGAKEVAAANGGQCCHYFLALRAFASFDH